MVEISLRPMNSLTPSGSFAFEGENVMNSIATFLFPNWSLS